MLLQRLIIKKNSNAKEWQAYRSISDKEKLVHTEIQARQPFLFSIVLDPRLISLNIQLEWIKKEIVYV